MIDFLRQRRSKVHAKRSTPLEQTSCTFICQWYTPEPAKVAKRIVEALTEGPIDVTVLTGIPHYPEGKVASGYSALRRRREVIDGVEVYRTPEYPSHSRSALRRTLTYLSWAVTASTAGLHRLRSSDVAVVYSSPATAALPALIAKLAFGTPYVLIIQDLWPDSIAATGFNRPVIHHALPLLNSLCTLFYRHADHITVISPGMADVLAARGVPPAKLDLVYNWVDTAQESLHSPPRGAARHLTRLLYAGNHGPAQNLGEVVRSVAARSDLRLTMVGDGIDKAGLMKMASDLDASNIEFHGAVNPSELTAYVEGADAQIVSLSDDPLFRATMPSKVQSILAAGMPVLAIAAGDVATVVDEARCGWTATPGNRISLEVALDKLVRATPHELDIMALNAREYFLAHMSRDRNAARLREIVASVATKRTGA